MCGIAGYVNFDGRPHDRSVVRRMCDTLVHRGPDGYGEYFDSHVALGHRRLSIIDVEGGSQPMANEDGSVQIVFNGEIYNYRELRDDLIKRGHAFATASDTEVIVHLYEEVGERVPEYLNGMFAFAIWNARERKLLLARDRFGEKPLYYSTDIPQHDLVFSSELKALEVVPTFVGHLRPESVADFLALSYVPDPYTMYRQVRRLEAGCSLTLTARAKVQQRYWSPAFNTLHTTSSLRDAVEEVSTLAADSVRRRTVADVPVGAFLSGGIDSSAVVALMAAMAPGRVRTFSIGFSDRRFDEVAYARLVADACGTDHREHTVSPDASSILPILQKHYDEPFGDASAVPTLYLARMTREYVTVALSGDGADEVFGGYRRYRYGVLEEQIRRRFPQWFRRHVLGAAGQVYPKLDFMPQVFRAKALLTNLSHEISDAYFNSMSVIRDGMLTELLAPHLTSSLAGYSSREAFRDRFARYRELPPLSQMQAVDCETYLPADILVKTDRATMAYSLESRAPWLDHRLAELAFSLPPAMRLHHGTGKRVFRDAFRPKLPEVILGRKKMGFSVPLAAWFRTTLRPVFEAEVLDGTGRSFFEIGPVRELYAEHQSGLADHSRSLWNVLMLTFWAARKASPADRSSATVRA